MIITTYRPDGTKERRLVGYGGGLCQTASAPYERREAPGTTKKTPTAEAQCDPVVGEKVTESDKLRQN